jgi:hypothetical protein
MKQIIKILLLLVITTLQAQKEFKKVTPIITESKQEVVNDKKCTCSICGEIVNCNSEELKHSDCEGRDFSGEDKSYKSRRPKGTHIIVVACTFPPYPNPTTEDGRTLSFANVINLAVNAENCPDVFMIGYQILDQNGIIVQQENLPAVQNYTANISNISPGTHSLIIQLDETIGDSNLNFYQIIIQ